MISKKTIELNLTTEILILRVNSISKLFGHIISSRKKVYLNTESDITKLLVSIE